MGKITEKIQKVNYRTTNLLVGLILIFIAIITMFYPDITNIIVVVILSMGLLFIGTARVVNAVSKGEFKNVDAEARFLSGVIAIIIGITAIIMIIRNTDLALDIWYYLLATALLIIGFSRIIVGIKMKEEVEKWFKYYTLFIGIATIIFSIIVYIIPEAGGRYIVVLISLSLLLNGVHKIILGIIGPK